MSKSMINYQRLMVKMPGYFYLRRCASSIALAFFLFLLQDGFAQSASVSLDRDKILLGEQVTMQLSLENVSEATFFVADWPRVNDTINNAEIVKRAQVDTININGINTYRQSFLITSFDSGRWQLGPFDFTIQDRITGKKMELHAPAVYLTVLPVDVSALKDYHPIKDIIDVETSFYWMPVIIAAAILLLAVLIFIFFKTRKKKITEEPKIVLKGTPLERAVEKLMALEKESLPTNGDIKKFHSAIDIITRQYFEEMTQVKAMQLTVAEIFSRMNLYMQDVQLRRNMYSIFELNASVKFAKYMPVEEESKNTLKEIMKSLYQIDDAINRSRINANRMVSKY